MGFVVGESVGPYKITEYVAQGGMATIFKAYQATLDRYVALKVIHPALKQDQAFVARLKREAAIIAKLNHPNIVSVYDFGDDDGLPYLVLQFVQGKTLKDVMRDEQFTAPQILKIIRPVARALAYAHDKGVLHRDVKPSNVLIDQDGQVYLSDFGLARITQSGESTMSQDMMIGSPQYISPEQARGENVGPGTDIYSLGVVMYEMFAGRVPFQGDTPYATILAQIGTPPPPPRSINPQIRPVVEQVLLKALAKEPTERYGTMREMLKALENAVQGPREEEFAPPMLQSDQSLAAGMLPMARLSKRQPTRLLRWMPLAAIASAILLVICLLTGMWLTTQSSVLGTTLTFTQVASSQNKTTPTIARASSTIASVTPVSTKTATLPAPTATPTNPPPPPTNTPVPPPPNPTALPTQAAPPIVPSAPRGRIAYSVGSGDLAEQHSIWLANADGSNPQKLIDLSMWPSISPDGTKIAYYRFKDEGIYVANLDGGNAKKIVTGETCCVEWSNDGKRLAYFAGKLKLGGSLFIVNADGTGNTEIAKGYNPSWSPDGSKIVYSGCEANTSSCGLHIYDLNSKVSATLTRDTGGSPQWSPLGNKIVYQAGTSSGLNVFVINADGSNQKQLTFGKSNDGQPTWSSDGNFIFWRSDQGGTTWGIFSMRADGSDKRLLINNVMPDSERWGRESLSAGP